MDKLKLAFKLVKAKNNAEKALMNLYSDANLNSSVDKPIHILIESFSHELHLQDANSYEVFVKYLRKCNSWKTAVKLLFATHQIIHKIGAPFCKAFTQEEFENIRNFSKSKQGTGDYIYEVMTANYYSFLVCYANCFEDIQVFSRIRQQEVTESIQQNQAFYLPKLSALKELVEYVTKIEGSIRNSLKASKHQVLFEKIAALIVSDTITANNIITDVLEEAKHLIFKVNPEIALMLDELYSDTVYITRKLEPFLKQLVIPSHLYIPPVKYFNFDPEFNRKEELFVLEIKKSGVKVQKPKPLTQREKAPIIPAYSAKEDKGDDLLSPSQINYLSNYQEIQIKGKSQRVQKVDSRGPLQEKMKNSSNYNQIGEAFSPDQPDEKKFLNFGASSPDVSSPSSCENLVDVDGYPKSQRNRANEDDSSILKSPEGSGFLYSKGKVNMNQLITRKVGSVPAKENARVRNQDLSPTEF